MPLDDNFFDREYERTIGLRRLFTDAVLSRAAALREENNHGLADAVLGTGARLILLKRVEVHKITDAEIDRALNGVSVADF